MTEGPEAWRERAYTAYRSALRCAPPNPSEAGTLARQFWRRWHRHLPADRGARILDLGCGGGQFLLALRDHGYTNIEGIDASPEQVTLAHGIGLSMVRQGDALAYLREATGTYDAVVTLNVLEHLTRPQLFEWLDAIVAALKPGGRLLAVVPNAKGLFGAHVRWADITHELSFAPTSVRQVCHLVGLDVERIEEHGPMAHGVASALRWVVWQIVRAGLYVIRVAEGAGFDDPVFTQDLMFVARRRAGAPNISPPPAQGSTA